MLFAATFGVFALLLWLFLILAPVALLILLQLWLCKKSLKLGLILPVLSLALSLLLVLGSAAFFRLNFSSGYGGSLVLQEEGQVIQEQVYEDGMVTVYDGDGNILEQYQDPNAEDEPESISPAALGAAALLFLSANIPTLIFGGIWLHCKNRRDFQNDLKKMKIQDLG